MNFNKIKALALVGLGLFTMSEYAIPARAVFENSKNNVVNTSIKSASSLAEKHARYPKEGEFFGYGDDGIGELQYNARYIFEQSKLPRTVFEHEKETIEYFKTLNINKMKENILAIWELSAADVIFNDAQLSGENPDINNADEFWARADERRPIFGLGDEHIVNVIMEKLDESTNGIIVELTDTGWTPLSTYLAITYNKSSGLRYFTLEKSLDFTDSGTVPYLLCYIKGNSRGSYYEIKNDKIAFINAIKDVLNSSSKPAASLTKL